MSLLAVANTPWPARAAGSAPTWWMHAEKKPDLNGEQLTALPTTSLLQRTTEFSGWVLSSTFWEAVPGNTSGNVCEGDVER